MTIEIEKMLNEIGNIPKDMSKEEVDDMRMSTITYAPHNSSPSWLQLRCLPLITYYNIVLQSIYICVKSNFHKNWNLVFLLSF